MAVILPPIIFGVYIQFPLIKVASGYSSLSSIVPLAIAFAKTSA
jgi:hypothetical protein